MDYWLLKLFEEVDALLSSDPRYRRRHISHLLHVDRHAVEKSVREARGVTLREYKQLKLLEKSLRCLIGNPDWSIKRVALSLGFRLPGDFTRFIKKSTGKTPTEIREH